jgi:predicted negative regulator of RcsB-dependent stress response
VLLNLKSKLLAIGAGIVAFLLGVIKFLSWRNKSLKKEANQAKADLKFREDIDTIDAEIEQEFSHRAEEARKDLDEDRIPDHLRNPRK